jgi:hypothetical protein
VGQVGGGGGEGGQIGKRAASAWQSGTLGAKVLALPAAILRAEEGGWGGSARIAARRGSVRARGG